MINVKIYCGMPRPDMVINIIISQLIRFNNHLDWRMLGFALLILQKSKQLISININPLDARRRYTDFAQTSIRAGLRYTVRTACYCTRRQMVYLLRYGV